jgi:hypothetical protein
MKKILITLMCTLGLALTAANASALTVLSIGDAFYVGSVNDGIPSSASAEVTYINTLNNLAAGAGDQLIGTETYNREGSTLAGVLPDVSLAQGTIKDESGTVTLINAGGFAYIVAKYDAAAAGSLVWYVNGADTSYTVPATFNGRGVSHISAYGDVTHVPDGGTTLGLLGLAMLGLGYVRQRLG